MQVRYQGDGGGGRPGGGAASEPLPAWRNRGELGGDRPGDVGRPARRAPILPPIIVGVPRQRDRQPRPGRVAMEVR
jgi:hypothetical protein